MQCNRRVPQRADGTKAGWRKPAGLLFLGLLLFGGVAVAPSHGAERLQHGRFDQVTLYRPTTALTGAVILLSGAGGWDEGMAGLARGLAARGALVAGISTPDFLRQIAGDGNCSFADGDLENLGHFVQAYARLPGYRPPVLAGAGEGATLAYAVLAQAPPGIFAGALSLGFRPRLSLGIPLCGIESLVQPADPRQPQPGHGMTRYLPAKRLSAAWILVQDGRDRDFPEAAVRDYVSGIRQASVVPLPVGPQDRSTTDRRVAVFSDAYSRLAATGPKADVPAALNDLPLIEMAATGRAPPALLDSYVVLLSGDGGWAGLDRSVAAVLQARGLPVVGFDSLRYFWTPRTPSGLSSDLARLLAYYENHWHRRRVLLVGYSQGADVLPFAVGELPPARRAGIGLVSLIGPGRSAAFEFHVSHWFGDGSQGLPILPEMQRLAGLRVQCLYGDDEASESLCPLLGPQGFDVRRLAGGHHFGGDYGAIAGQILEAARVS